ncbi:hypothetical protein BGW37DRAFT_517822 [Umbelopsis sp. PMI_123]|nr:hypothetical protein BGW37DRAFT_517822 [Umbelopsis sp. PMI_123]
MTVQSLGKASRLDICPTEIRQYIFKLLGLSLDAHFASRADALLDGISLSLAYPHLAELYHYLKHSLEHLPLFCDEELSRFSELSRAAVICSVNHKLLHIPKVIHFSLDALKSFQLQSESDHLLIEHLPSNIYGRILHLFPNISSIYITCNNTYTYCPSHETQLIHLTRPIEHQLQVIQLSLPVSNGNLFGSLAKCFENSKLQKVSIQGFMSMATASFLKEQRHIRQFMATDVNGHVLEQVIQQWPFIEDIDIAGIALLSSTPNICRAIYSCSNHLRRLTLSGTCEAEVRGCLGWITDDQDEDTVIDNITAAYNAVIGCCAHLTHLSISKFPICGEKLLPLLKQRLRKLEELEFVSRPTSLQHNSVYVYPCI